MDVPIPAKILPVLTQTAADMQKAQSAFNGLVDIILKSLDKSAKKGTVNVNFDKKVFEIDSQT